MSTSTRPSDVVLTADQVRAYEADGYLILEGLFSRDEVRAMQRAAEELSGTAGPIEAENPRLQVDVTAEGTRIRQVWPLIDISPPFMAVANDPRVIGIMRSLFGEAPALFEDKLNYKYPRGGTAFAMHQDYAYWEGFSTRLTTLLIYLDDSTEENGCLQVVRGRHRGGLIPHHRISGPKSDLTMPGPDDAGSIAKVIGPAGTAAVFSCWTPHASGPNLSDRPRRALIFTYNPVSDGDAYEANTGRVLREARQWLDARQRRGTA